VEQRHGPLSRVDAAAQACLLQAIKERPDRTLVELQRILAEQRGVRLCIAQLSNVLKRLNLRLKKSRSTPPSAIPKPLGKSARSLSSVSARYRRSA